MRLLRNQIIIRPLVALTLIGHCAVYGWSMTPLADTAAGPYAQWLRSQLVEVADESFEQALVLAATGPVSSLSGFVDAFVDAYASKRHDDVGGAFGESLQDAEALRSYLKHRFQGLSGVALTPRQTAISAVQVAAKLAGAEATVVPSGRLFGSIVAHSVSAASADVIRFLFGAAQPLGP